MPNFTVEQQKSILTGAVRIKSALDLFEMTDDQIWKLVKNYD